MARGYRLGAALALAAGVSVAAPAGISVAASAAGRPPLPASLLPPTPDQPRPDQKGPDQPGPDQAGPDRQGPGQPSPDASSTPVVEAIPGQPGQKPLASNATLATAVPIAEPVMTWSVDDAAALLQYIPTVDREGLTPADYQPDDLRAAIAAAKAGGPATLLDQQASRSFDWLVEDLRDGRTPMSARTEWFAIDPDADLTPTASVLTRALVSHDIAGTLQALDPANGEFGALKEALAATPPDAPAQRDLIRVNMDRWRWLPRDLGLIYLIVNVPEFQVRLVSNHQVIRTYRTIVGRPGRTATPQLAETVQGVVFNPTWTVPQSIIQHEPSFARLAANPESARRQGYAATTSASGMVTLVQQPGPRNSLGLMKIDMPNPHAIYLHDTPSRALFNAPSRAFSHGCIRTEKAVELGMIMAMLGANLSLDDAVAKANAHKYARVAMSKTFPVYINYSTYGRDTAGQLTRFKDIYGRDGPVLASLAAPRQLHTTQRVSAEPVIKAEDPL